MQLLQSNDKSAPVKFQAQRISMSFWIERMPEILDLIVCLVLLYRIHCGEEAKRGCFRLLLPCPRSTLCAVYEGHGKSENKPRGF